MHAHFYFRLTLFAMHSTFYDVARPRFNCQVHNNIYYCALFTRCVVCLPFFLRCDWLNDGNYIIVTATLNTDWTTDYSDGSDGPQRTCFASAFAVSSSSSRGGLLPWIIVLLFCHSTIYYILQVIQSGGECNTPFLPVVVVVVTVLVCVNKDSVTSSENNGRNDKLIILMKGRRFVIII